MADIKEETEAGSNVIPVTENKTEHGINLNITEGTSEREGKKCSCGQMSCASCIVKFESTNNFNKELSNSSYCQSLSNKRVRTCNRCGEEFSAISAYRKHYMKCWRAFRKKVSLVRSNKTFAKANKNFHKKKFPINTGNSFPAKKTCHLCGMHFRSAMHCTMHMRKKGFCRPPPFVCSNCGKTFKTIHHLVNHEKRKTPCTTNKDLKPTEEDLLKSVSFTEDDTEQATTKKSIKTVSKKSDSDSNNLKCIKCNAQFSLFYWYNRHISHPSSCKPNGYKRNKDKDLSWNLTGKNLPSLEEYKTAEGYRCQKCGHIFRFPYRLLAHLQRKVPCTTQIPRKLASSEKPDPVENYHEPNNTVGASVHLQRNVLNSEKTNAGIKIIKKYWRMAKTQSKKQNIVKYGTLICCICDKTFFNSYTWNSHLKIHSTTGDKCLVKCPVCFSIFPSADELHCHQQETNHWGKLMKSRINHCRCPFCDKKFAYLGSRQNHVQRHLEDYPVQAKEFLDSTTCSYCELYFASEAKKTAHIRKVHPNVELAEKKKSIVKFSEGTQKFNSEESTKSKDKMKSDASSPLPPVISRNVDNAITVKGKKNIKTGSLHSCSFCEKKFVWLERLIAHQQAVHSSLLIFQCSSCHQKFSSWSIIIHHIKKKHKNSKEDNLIIELGKSDDYKSECLNSVTMKQESQVNGDNAALVNNSSSQEVYSCAVCKVDSFSSRSALIRHRKTRIHRRNLKLNFNSMSKLILHPRRNKHAIKCVKFNCSVCSQSFKSLSSFVPHRLGHFNFENPDLISVDENNPFCCEICSESIYQYQEVHSHLLNHLQQNKAKPHHTKVADLSVTSDNKGDLTELPRNSEEVMHDTKQAQELDSQNSEIFQRKNEPVKNVNFICKLCKMGFRTKRSWKTHVRYHCALKRTCKNCKECFKSRKRFLMHRAACDMTYKKHRCQYCSLDFSSSDDVGWHEKSCQKVRGTEGREFNLNNMNNLFHCQYCQAPFLSLETCQEHEKQFCKNTCSVCKAHFTSPELLNEHMNEFHDAKQSVTCSTCGIYLETTNALHIHLKTHECYTNENTNFKNEESKSKPNKTSVCPYCNKIYRGPYSLKEHLVIHNPFKCPICGKLESDIRGFRKHPCRLPNGTFATGIKYRRKWSKTKIAQMREEYCASLLTGQGHGSFQEIKEIQKTSETDMQQTCKNSNFQDGCLDNSDKSGLDEKVTLDTLRENFSQLLYLFVADPELMNELGWGQRLIDDVLADVLQNMGQKSVIMDATCSQIECLRENIRLLLRVCIKDQIMDAVDGENKLVDDIVIDMLGMCKASLENQMPMADVVS